MLDTDKRKKKSMISENRADFIHKCGKVWKGYVAGKTMVVVTDHKITPEALFENYFDIICIGIKQGLVKLKTLSEITLEDLNEPERIIEF